MRTAVIEKIHELMSKHDNIYFLTADLGYSVLEGLEKSFPKRFLNIGVAEQNMIGIAAGLALNGKVAYVYSIIPFVTLRCLEQIRDDICYHNLNVNIIGVGTGLSYGILGSTHFALEDIGIMRSLPNMTVISPTDAIEASLTIEASYSYPKPTYIRIGKKEEPQVHFKKYNYKIGKGVVLNKGKDIVIFTTGTIASNAIEAAKILKVERNISSTIVVIHTLKPVDVNLVYRLIKNKKAVFTVEEHSVIGGLGTVISELIVQAKKPPKLKKIGTADGFVKHIGSQTYLRGKLGLSPDAIVRTILKTLKT